MQAAATIIYALIAGLAFGWSMAWIIDLINLGV